MKHITITTVIMALLLSVLTGCNGAETQTEYSSQSQAETVDEVIEVTKAPENDAAEGVRKINHSGLVDGNVLKMESGVVIPYYDEVKKGIITTEDINAQNYFYVQKALIEWCAPKGTIGDSGCTTARVADYIDGEKSNIDYKKVVSGQYSFVGEEVEQSDAVYYYFALYEHYPEGYSPIKFSLYGLPTSVVSNEYSKSEQIMNTYSTSQMTFAKEYEMLTSVTISKTDGFYVDMKDLYGEKEYAYVIAVYEFDREIDDTNFCIGCYNYTIVDGKEDEYTAWKQENKEAYLSVVN